MARHMFVTTVVVLSVYLGLLVVIGHPFVAHATGKTEKKDDTTSMNNEALNRGIVEKKFTPKLAEHEARQGRSPVFKGATIVGISSVVNLDNNLNDVNRVWEQLFKDRGLVNNVNWRQGNVNVYAYYTDFSADLNQATLVVGFDVQDLALDATSSAAVLPTGEFQHFSVDRVTGQVTDEAWVFAYANKNLIERHTLNSNGESVSIDAIVIMKEGEY